MFRRAVFDTNILIDWLNRGLREELILAPGLVRYLSAVVVMELRAGARAGAASKALDGLTRSHAAGRRVVAPGGQTFDDAGAVLARLRRAGRDVTRASFVNDVLIALTCREIGATLYTTNADDLLAIRAVRDFALEIVPAR